jgi:hypothetical protein
MILQIPRRAVRTRGGDSETSTYKPGDVLELYCGKGAGSAKVVLIQ